MKDKFAFIFDLDGTLVDTNKLHADTWAESFISNGYDIDYEQIKMAIGKGGDNLIRDFLGDIDKSTEEKLSSLKSDLYNKKLETEQIRIFGSADEIMHRLHHLGILRALATSGSKKDIAALNEANKTHQINLDNLFDEIITFDQVESSKPDPDLIHKTIEKLGVMPQNCIMVGDTTYDIAAAKKAGVRSIGLMSGFHSFELLQNEGAVFVFKNIEDLFNHIDDVIFDLFHIKTKTHLGQQNYS